MRAAIAAAGISYHPAADDNWCDSYTHGVYQAPDLETYTFSGTWQSRADVEALWRWAQSKGARV